LNQSILIPFLLSLAAGLSTGLGALIIFIFPHPSPKFLGFSLGFSAGIMLAVSFHELLPEGMVLLGQGGIVGIKGAVCFGIGAVIAALIDRLVPGAAAIDIDIDNDIGAVARVGFISMIALMIHNFPEGIATFMSGYKSLTLGISITVAIALHNIPEGIAIAVPIYYATGDRKRAIAMPLLSGLTEPIGALAAALLLQPIMTDAILGGLFCMIAGIMLYIAFKELMPAARSQGGIFITLIGLACGVIILGFAMSI